MADFHFLSWLDFVSSVGRFVILHHEKGLPMQQISWKMEKTITLREVTDYLDRLRVQFMATIRLDGDFATTRSSKIFLLVIAKIFSLGFLQ